MLGYLALLLKEDNTRDVDRAISLCQPAADKGDAYAQYILAWALLLKGDPKGCSEYLGKSVRQLFPPALLDIAGVSPVGLDREGVNRERYKAFKNAERVGHIAALPRKLAFYRSGNLGAWKRALGYLLVPWAAMRVLIHATLFPYSATTFFFLPISPARIVRFK
jgi:hypothetical protein